MIPFVGMANWQSRCEELYGLYLGLFFIFSFVTEFEILRAKRVFIPIFVDVAGSRAALDLDLEWQAFFKFWHVARQCQVDRANTRQTKSTPSSHELA